MHLRCAATILCGWLAGPPAVAQSVPVIELEPADATLTEPFTRIFAIRELSDGRVLISDSRENRLVVADLQTGSVREIGRRGRGPGEYEYARQLFALPGDSTLFIDGDWGLRWLILVGDRIVRTLPLDQSPLRASAWIVGVDSAGHVLGIRTVQVERLAPSRTRKFLGAILVHRDRRTVDTLARLRGSEFVIGQTSRNGRPFWIETAVEYTDPEQAVLFPDGWIAFARTDPYRVEWRSPDGTLTRGPALPWTRIPVNEREKRAHLERTRRVVGPGVQPYPYWAESIPPFRSSALVPLLDGSLAILKSQWSGAPGTNYDIVDRRGALTGRLELPFEERIVGFGAQSIYISVTDQDGLQFLRRHPWP